MVSGIHPGIFIRRLVGFFLLLGTAFLGACQTTPDYFLIYPDSLPPGVSTWQEDISEDGLLMHFSWAKPAGNGPFPTVMVHPHGGKTTEEMQGVIWDLAKQGFLAVAVDYKRLIDGKYQRNTFVWNSDADITRALTIIIQSNWVDQDRVAAMGFSQGGMLSLIIAAHASDKLKTVVAYYPVADFNEWFEKSRNPVESIVFYFIRSHFYSESRSSTEEEFQQLLEVASPLKYASRINVPVLLVHGDADSAASVDESEKLYNKLKALNKNVKLVVVPGGVHIFNFRQEQQARFAWETTLSWLKEYLGISRQ
ncbi:alpha/beta hydrolase family protein [Kaarinaea lacus]